MKGNWNRMSWWKNPTKWWLKLYVLVGIALILTFAFAISPEFDWNEYNPFYNLKLLDLVISCWSIFLTWFGTVYRWKGSIPFKFSWLLLYGCFSCLLRLKHSNRQWYLNNGERVNVCVCRINAANENTKTVGTSSWGSSLWARPLGLLWNSRWTLGTATTVLWLSGINSN